MDETRMATAQREVAAPADRPAFVNSHAHLIPTDVWQDYMQISHAAENWQLGLDRYGINTILLDQRVRGPLIASLKRNEQWKFEYEDDIAALFVRKNPIGHPEVQKEKQEVSEKTEEPLRTEHN